MQELLVPQKIYNIQKVFKGTDISNGNTVAIKLIKVESFDNFNGVVGELIVNEINIMKEIENDNVVKFFNYFQSTNYAYIIMEYCDGGNLQDYWIQNRHKLPPFEALKIMKQILNGMRGLHEKFVIHRDLKLANILIHEDVIKIADLGFSCRIRHQNDLQQLTLGTLGTMAPEVASGSEYGLEADVFSVGAIFYQLLFGQVPFDDSSFDAFLYDVRNRKPTFYKVDSTYDDLLQDLLSKMLEYDRTKRITFAQIYDHPIMNKQAPRGSLIDKGSVKLNSVDFTKSQQFYKDNQVIISNQKLPILDLNHNSQEQDQIVEVEEDNIDSVKVIPINQQRNKNVSQPYQQDNQNNLQSDKFNGRRVNKIDSNLVYEQNQQILTPQEDSEGQKRRKIDYGCKIYLDFYNYIQTLIQLSEDLQLVQYKNVYPIMYPRLQLQKLIYFKQYDLMDDIRKKKNEFNLDYIDEIIETQEIKYVFERLYKEVAESKEVYCFNLYKDLKSNFQHCQQYIDDQLMSSAKISFDKDFHKNFKNSIKSLRDYLYNQENDNVKQSDQMLRIILNITNLLNLSNKEFKQLYGRVRTMDINSLINEVTNAIKRE